MTQNNHAMQSHDYENEDVIDLRFLFGLLKAHLGFIAVITVVCVLLAGIYAITRPAIYESSALIKVNQDSNANASNMMAMLGIATGSSSGGLMSASPAEIETALIQSDYIMGAVSDELGLNINVTPKYFPVLGHLFAKLFFKQNDAIKIKSFTVPKAQIALPFELVREQSHPGDYVLYGPNEKVILHGKVGEVAHSEDGSITIQIDAWKSHARNKFVIRKEPTNIAVKNLLTHLTIKEQGEKTGILSISYQSTNREQAQIILNAILKVAVEANIAEKAAEATKTLSFLKEQLPKITRDLDQSEQHLNDYRSQTGAVDDQIEAELLLQEVVALQKDLSELNLKKLELLENFTPNHPYIIALNQKQKKIEEQLNTIKAHLRTLPLTAQESANFMRDIKVHGEIYSGVMQTLQQMEMLKGSTVSSVRVLENASFPALPIPSKTSLILLISLILGVSLSTAILLLQYSLSKTLDPLLIEKLLGVQVLAIIPHSLAQTKLVRDMRGGKEKNKNYLLSQQRPKDPAIEALRSLRTALKLIALDGDKKIIAISGCSPNVGKSFASSNLIALLADLDLKVLLIDADMRKGHLNKTFSCPQSPGLSEYLEGKISLEKSISSVLPKVDIMTTGAYPENPADLLAHERFKQLIAQVSQDYDFILIDTPPVLAVTDASLIFKFSDIRLLLVGLAKDQLKEIEHTKGVLAKAGLMLDGIVCNNANQAKSYGYKSNYYTYNYHYEYK